MVNLSTGVCCIFDEPLMQQFGWICCNRRCGFCPCTCCSYDADSLCWGAVCVGYEIDLCGLFRLLLDASCLPVTPCIGYVILQCILTYSIVYQIEYKHVDMAVRTQFSTTVVAILARQQLNECR